MTTKAKAKELISKFNNSYDEESKRYILYQNVDESKRCALIAVDEILNFEYIKNAAFEFYDVRSYWQEVRNEILKL